MVSCAKVRRTMMDIQRSRLRATSGMDSRSPSGARSGREDRVAAEGIHRGLEGEARAERGLLEEEDHLPGVERVAEVVGVGFHGVRELENGDELLRREVGHGAEIAADEALGELR